MTVDDQNYVDEAEKAILKLKNLKDREGKGIPMVTASKLRNLLAMAMDIYNGAMNQGTEKLDSETCSRIEYLRVRFLYEAGRDNGVKNLVKEADIINVLKSVKGSRERYITFNRYMEALVAFHRYYGGKEN